MQRVFRSYAVLAVISFLLHLAWERLHIPLYTGYEALEGVLPVYLFATLGDVTYTLLVVVLIAVARRNPLWLTEARFREYAFCATAGFFVALFVEYKAALLGRWEYTDAMPLLFSIGLSPLVQMTALLPLSVYVSVRVEKWLYTIVIQ